MILLPDRWRRLLARPLRADILQPSKTWLAASADETWWSVGVPTNAADITIAGAIRGPIGNYPKGLVVRLRYFAEGGDALEFIPIGWSRSQAAGTYKYLQKVQDQNHFSLSFEIPPAAKTVQVCFQKWGKSAPDAFAIQVESIEHALEAPSQSSIRPDKEVERALHRLVTKAASALDFPRAPPLLPDQLPLTEAVTEAYIRKTGSAKLARSLGKRWLKAGRSRDVARIAPYARSPRLTREMGRLELLEFVRGQPPRPERERRLKNRGILYLLHNCRPYDSGGYASRAQGLLTGFLKNDWRVQPVARLGYPWDKKSDVNNAPHRIKVEEIEYIFLENAGSVDQEDQIRYVQDYADIVLNSINTKDVGIVIAPSFYHNAFAGRIIADKLEVPLVYEVRGLHWFTLGSQNDWWQSSDQGQMMRSLEIEAARQADLIFTITDSLKTWLQQHEITSPIDVLPNGCFAEEAAPIAAEAPARERFGIPLDAFVVGYIGTFVYYEGIERLIEAVQLARDWTGSDIHLLLVGDGPNRASVERAHSSVGSPDYIHMVGRVSPEQIGSCYAAIDVIGLAREDLEVCHVISPLKPLEAMLMQKAMIASDVLAMKEIIEPSGSGLLYPADNTEALAKAIMDLSSAPEKCRAMAQNGHAWALRHRTWESIAQAGGATILKHFPLELEGRPNVSDS